MYHAVNLGLHALNCFLLMVLLGRLWTGIGWRRLLVTAVFAVHPAVTEAVCNVTCRADLLVVTWILTSALLVGGAVAPARRATLLALLALLALFTKENGLVLLPVVVLIHGACCDTGPDGWRRWWAVVREHRRLYLVALATVVVGLLVRAAVLGKPAPDAVITPPELNILAYEPSLVRMLTGVKILGLAVWKFIWPFPLTFDYGTSTIAPARSLLDPGVLGGLAFWTAAAGFAVWAAARKPQGTAGVLIVLGTLLPVSNLLLPITSIFNERFLYLPLIGVVVLVAWVVAEPRTARVGGLLLAALVAVMAVATWNRTADWHSVESIVEATAESSPHSANAVMDLAGLRARQGDTVAQGTLLQQAVAAFPESPRANYALGQWYQRDGRVELAKRHFAVALTDRPTQTSLKAAMKLGYLNAVAGQNDAAIRYYSRALSIHRDEPGAHYALALLYRGLDDDQARSHAERARQLGRPVPAPPRD